MSGERAPLPADGNGLLRGGRSRSYGSLVRSPLSPVRQRRVEHELQPGETLQGLALKYGVTMEQIKRANRLYTNDSIFLKKSLSIPVLSGLNDGLKDGKEEGEEEEEESGRAPARNGHAASSSENKPRRGEERASDLNPADFLKRLDDLINESKQAAVTGCQEAEKRFAALEAACGGGGASERRPLARSQSVASSSRTQQQQQAASLTVTKLTEKLRDREDEIFQL